MNKEPVQLIKIKDAYYICHHGTDHLVKRKDGESDTSYKATALAHFNIFVSEYNKRPPVREIICTDYLNY